MSAELRAGPSALLTGLLPLPSPAIQDRLVVLRADRASGGLLWLNPRVFSPVWGLLELAVWPTVFGATLVVMAQLWRIDRLVWMYEELTTSRCGHEAPS